MRAILRNPEIAAFGVDLDALRPGHAFTLEHPAVRAATLSLSLSPAFWDASSACTQQPHFSPFPPALMPQLLLPLRY